MASGAGSQIGLTKLGSLYHTVDSVNIWTNFKSTTLDHMLDRVTEGAINGRRDMPPSYKGIDHGAGDIVFEPNPNALGHLFNMTMGDAVSSLVCDAGSTGANSGMEAGKAQWFHRFTPRASAYSAQSFLKPYGIMVYKDVGSAFMFDGSVSPDLELNFQAGQLVGATASYMTRGVRRISRTAAISSLVSAGGKPWLWDMASVELGSGGVGLSALVANTNFESLSIKFTSPVEGVVLLDGTKQYAEFQANGFRECNLNGTLSFRNQNEYEAFKAYDGRAFRITVMNVNSNLWLGNPASLDNSAFLGYSGMRVVIPTLKFTKYSVPIQGPNRLQVSFEAAGEFDETNGLMYYADLLNVTSGY